ncbi:type I phosphomannose isomerase catalytic subunit [Treponema sp. HNW]|uniref:type I phosphomannose isomerase catalytic subunit n=1 Tax=Treponema sp. HNW TaxID=3116654 RepID=UPI003D0F1DA3
MFKTEAFVSEKIWGYERWILSTHKAGESLADKSTEFIGGKKLSSVIGADYPLLVKVIQADETLSVQVHPDDEYARLHENSAGKTECWYILDAKEGASLIYGLNGIYSREELKAAIENQKLDNYLRSVPVSKGDFVFIPAGTVHAIQGGLRLLEIQQSSDITYRLYDWGRPREIHVEKSLDVIKPFPPDSLNVERPFGGSFSCPYFNLEKYDYTVRGSVCFAKKAAQKAAGEQNGQEPTPAMKTSWLSLFIISGTGTFESNTGERLSVQAEDCVIVGAEEKITLIPDAGSTLSVMHIS